VLYAGPGAMLSHATALWWRGLLDHQPWPIGVSTPRRCRSLRAVKVHGRRTCARIWHKRLPTTSVEQAPAGRAGSTKLRNALARHEPKLANTRSPLERLFLPLCETYRVPLPDDVNVPVAGILVDAVWWQERLVVELDGKGNHSSWAQIQHDRSNELTLRAAGLDVLRYGTVQLEDEAALVARDVITRLSSTAQSA